MDLGEAAKAARELAGRFVDPAVHRIAAALEGDSHNQYARTACFTEQLLPANRQR